MPNQKFESLKNKWIQRHRDIQTKLYEKHKNSVDWFLLNFPNAQQLAAGALGGLMLLTVPVTKLPQGNVSADQQPSRSTWMNKEVLAGELSKVVPSEMRPLSNDEDQAISGILTDNFGFKVVPQISGMRLNRSYGLIGAEQHLYRYPGDTLDEHADNATDAQLYQPSGIAPGLGAWGYFAPSKEQFTEKDKQREKWYIAVQTFLAPEFNQKVSQYRDFFKYRKMLLVNPTTGQAVVTDVADAGPAEFTGKHLGGSPEVMNFLGYQGGPRKGPVLFFFIDDPNDTIPLGPISVAQ